MKKNIIIAAISVASVILLAASCQKQEEPEIKNESKTFTAVIDQELTKTAITSEYKVNWNEGDQIDINAGTTYSATPNTSDATKATFTKVSGSDPDGEYGYTAVYPASLFKNSVYELPTTQIYATGKFNAPMCAMSDTESLEFKNFCGVLCFALKGTDKVRSIAVTANEQLCGPFEFMDATVICFSGENKGYTVTLDCGTEGIPLDETTATNFYIYLPQATYTAGMKMTVTNTDGETFEKTTTKSAEIVRSNIYSFNWTPSFAPVIPAGALSGKFTINENGDQVYFSKGNLYYDGSAFKFEDSQTGFASEWNPNYVSHFYWSKTASEAYAQYYEDRSAAADDEFFTNEKAETAKADFTVNDVTGKYRTLSADEWTYLFNTRTASTVNNTANARYVKATVNSKTGIILLPDNYTHPSGVTALTSINTENAAFSINNYNVTDWTAMESVGAVFLPAAGVRNGFYVHDVGSLGFYWSSSTDKGRPYDVYFRSEGVSPDYRDYRNYGYSVRLVTDCD